MGLIVVKNYAICFMLLYTIGAKSFNA